jgi:hypothetical protein
VIARRKMDDAAPLPHLQHHVSPQWREFIVKVGGTPEGHQWAKTVQQWAAQAMALAIAAEFNAQQIAQTYGTGDGPYAAAMARADKYRKRAAILEQEAEALRTTHEQPKAFMGDAAACETYRRRLEQVA